MDYRNYIKSELLVLIPVLYFLGTGLKKSAVADKWIPLILGAASCILSGIWVFASCDISGSREIAYALFTAVTQGILLAGTSVYVNQIYIQSKKEE